jgi:uncharacterized protein (TIGR03437 family)
MAVMLGIRARFAPHRSPRFAIALLGLVSTGPSWAQQCDSEVIFSGPIVITTGGTYTGNWQSTDPSVAAVTVLATEPVIILNSRIEGPGPLLRSYSKGLLYPAIDLTVQGSCFVGTNPNIAGTAKGFAFDVYQPVSLLVQFCDFESVRMGVYVDGYRGDYSPNHTIKVLNNRFHNVDGRLSDGNGGYIKAQPGPGGSAVQLNHVLNVPGMEVGWNQVVEEPNQSRVEDTVSLFLSSGTASTPIQVHDNYIRGSYAANAANADGLNLTSQVINTDGDFTTTDPSQATGFIKIHDNQAVSIGFNGIGISNGHDIEVYSNRVVSNGQAADGTNITRPYGSGVIHHNYYQNPPGVFGNNSAHDNLSGYRRRTGNGTWERADYSFTVPPTTTANNASWTPITPDSPTLSDEANELLLWNEKLIANGMTVGSNLVSPTLNGSVQIVSGNNQVGGPKATLPSPLSARVVNQSGNPVAGVNVSFMVATGNATASQHFAVTDANGLASSSLILGTAPAAVQVNVIAAGYTGTNFSLWITQPAAAIAKGGIAGVGGSVPAVQMLSQNALISIYGQGFLPAGVTGRRVLPSEYVNGGLPPVLLGVCVDMGGQRAALLDVYPTQINAQVPAVTGSTVSVRVQTYCGTPAETASAPQTVAVSAASPEFLYFQANGDGTNPVVLVNAVTGALMGPSNILNGALTPAHAGDILTAYGTGFGSLTPALATGQIPTGTASAVGPVSVTIGGVELASTDILYAGAAPGSIIDQLNFQVPAGTSPGNQPIVISIAGVSSPVNAFVAIQSSQSSTAHAGSSQRVTPAWPATRKLAGTLRNRVPTHSADNARYQVGSRHQLQSASGPPSTAAQGCETAW